LTFLAAALGSANVFGGYVVTGRMLTMFKKPQQVTPRSRGTNP
jgi:NAD/NADP transhydrogenase alpha subunit